VPWGTHLSNSEDSTGEKSSVVLSTQFYQHYECHDVIYLIVEVNIHVWAIPFPRNTHVPVEQRRVDWREEFRCSLDATRGARTETATATQSIHGRRRLSLCKNKVRVNPVYAFGLAHNPMDLEIAVHRYIDICMCVYMYLLICRSSANDLWPPPPPSVHQKAWAVRGGGGGEYS